MATEPSGFESLVDAHGDEIFAYLWRMLGDASEAEDCLQDTFLRAYRAYDRFQDRGKDGADSHPRAWLYTIATNVARTNLRRRMRLSGRTQTLDPNLPDPTADPAGEALHRIQLAQVRAAVDRLPPRQQAALLLRKYQGLSYREIGEVLACTEPAARAHVYQALKKLRYEFSD